VKSSRAPFIAGVVLIILFAALYFFTLDNGLRPGELEGGDLITHQYAQVQARFSNAPGYPLYTMGGWLWFQMGRLLFGPHSNPVPILSSYSTLWALVSLALLYALCLKTAGRARWPIAFLVTASFGLTYFFWYYAVNTEQYTSSVAWTLIVVLLAFRWEETRRDKYLLVLAFLTGVGLAHQITVLAILPPLAWFVLSLDSGLLRRGRLVPALVALAALPLLSYAYVYIRGAQHPEWRGVGEWSSHWSWFLSFVSTGQGRGELTWSLRPFFTAEFPALIWLEMTWPGLIAGLLGIAALGRRRAGLFYATIVIYVVFCWIDRLGNWYQVIMPVYALLALGLAAGAGWLMDRFRGRGVYAGILVALAALAIYRGVISYPRADSSNRPDDTALDPAWAIVADDPPSGARILGTQQESLSLTYLTQIWGIRPDLRPITAREAAASLPRNRVAVTASALPLVPAEVSPGARYSAIGRSLALISLAPATGPAPGLAPWIHDFGGQLRLLGGRMTGNEATGERVVLLNWLAPAKPSHDWSISVRLTQEGQDLAQQDNTHPVWGAYPTTRWLPGEVVGDAYAFSTPESAQPDGVTVIVYRGDGNGGFVNLDVARFALGN
jgi:hypothetical protein